MYENASWISNADEVTHDQSQIYDPVKRNSIKSQSER